ncbi:hypothetical protein GOBAR_DD13070 [Gossypium barbadense]|nr:hypothetical protein GOBAR_DD13070 [Gossypium barbadense]
MDGTRVVILSMGFFIGLIMLGFVIAAAYASMKDDAEHKEDGVKREPKNGSDADEVLEATKVIVEANNNIAETIGDIDVDETVQDGVRTSSSQEVIDQVMVGRTVVMIGDEI